MNLLTDKEINAMAVACTAFSDVADHFVLDQESFARAIEAAVLAKFGEPVGYFEQEYVGGPVLFYQVNYSRKDEPGVIPLYAIKKEGA